MPSMQIEMQDGSVITRSADGSVVREWRNADGHLHRDGDQPALIGWRADATIRTEAWYQDGLRHRETGPAWRVYWPDGTTVRAEGYLQVRAAHDDVKASHRHHADGPAEVTYDRDGTITRSAYAWWGELVTVDEHATLSAPPPLPAREPIDAFVIGPLGGMRDVELHDHQGSYLTALYRLIGCRTVDVVALTDGVDMWLDEEGMLAADPDVNLPATGVAASFGLTHQPYFGTAVFTGGPDEEGNVTSLSATAAKELRRRAENVLRQVVIARSAGQDHITFAAGPSSDGQAEQTGVAV